MTYNELREYQRNHADLRPYAQRIYSLTEGLNKTVKMLFIMDCFIN